MNILWLSNSPLAPSGYGGQTALFTKRLRDLGHEVTIAANFGLQAATLEWNEMTVFPAQGDWGNGVISTIAKHVGADWVICLCDSWVMKPDKWADDLRMAIWTPVDLYPPPPAVVTTLQHPKVRPIAMSRFGQQWLDKAQLAPLYVPHGIDTAIFRPQPEHRAAARRALSIPEDAFLVGMVGANRGWSQHACRKAFPQALDAFARFAREREDAYLYLHTEAVPEGGPGIDLSIMAKAMNCPPERVAFPPPEAFALQIMDDHFVSGVYSALDVLLNPSMSEGFGIPIIEAQACGVPVIVSNHSSMPELLGAGWMVEGDRWWDGAQLGFAIMPSIASIESALRAAYESREDTALRERAVAFASAYDADRVTQKYWVPALEALERPREIAPLSRQARRAQERKAVKA